MDPSKPSTEKPHDQPTAMSDPVRPGSLTARAPNPTPKASTPPTPGESSSDDDPPPRSTRDGSGDGNGSGGGNGTDSSLSGSTLSFRSGSLSGGETASIVPSESSRDERSMKSSKGSIDHKSDDKKTFPHLLALIPLTIH